MSMTLINFVKKDNLPTKIELENKINELGYDFKFLTDFEKFDNFNHIDSIDCVLNENQIFIEIYLNSTTEILSNFPNLKKDLLHKDFCISFTFGSNELISACINLISIGLIDLSQSIVFYAEDEIFYTREMLIQDTGNSLEYSREEIYSIPKEAIEENLRYDQKRKTRKRNEKIKNVVLWSLLFFAVIMMNRKIISWHIPCLLLAIVLIKTLIDHKKR